MSIHGLLFLEPCEDKDSVVVVSQLNVSHCSDMLELLLEKKTYYQQTARMLGPKPRTND